MRRECRSFISLSRVLLFLALFILLGVADARAQCSNPSGVAADIKFNSSHNVMQYCDGTTWQAMGPLDPCADPVATPGTRCRDGTIYAGDSPDGSFRMFTTPADAPLDGEDRSWNNKTMNWFDTPMENCTPYATGTQESCLAGELNSRLLVGLSDIGSPYKAASYCDSLAAHGYSDWYLPARDEMAILISNRNLGNLNGTLLQGWGVWTSSEITSNTAINFLSSGSINAAAKSGTSHIRCVRKQDGPFSDWKELTDSVATGGVQINDVAIQGDKIVVVGNSGLIKTSEDRGETWSDRTGAAGFGGALNVMRVAYAGSTIITGSSSSSPSLVMKRSDDDGASWTNITGDMGLAAGLELRNVEYDGRTAAAVFSAPLSGNGRALKVSTDDGVSWVDRTAPIYTHYSNVALHNDAIVTVGSTNHDDVQISTDRGLTWVDSDVGSARWYGVDYDGSRLVVSANNGGNKEYRFSANTGQTWTNYANELGISANPIGALIAGEYLFARSIDEIKYSATDGATWVDVTDAIAFGSSNMNSFHSDGDYILVGGAGGVLKIAPVGCENPAKPKGSVVYNTNGHTAQFCDGVHWVPMGPPKPPTTGLVGWWKLDEASGMFKDSSGFGNDGTQSGGVSYASAGVIGNAAKFDGVDDYVQSSSGIISIEGDYSVSLWFSPNTLPQIGVLLALAKSPGTLNDYDSSFNLSVSDLHMNTAASTLNYREYDDSATYRRQDGIGTLSAGEWHHAVAVSTETSFTIYLNGSSVYSTSVTKPPGPFNIALMRIGQSSVNSHRFSGRIDDVRIYNRALRPDEIADLYAATSDPCDPRNNPAPGQVCDDGSVYAGITPDGNEHMYTTPADAGRFAWTSGATPWHDTLMANCTDGPPGSSLTCRTGEDNTNFLVGADADNVAAGKQIFTAAQYCADLEAHSQTDWYMPAADEVNVLYLYRLSIGGFDTVSGISDYQSSSEQNWGYKRTQKFSTGVASNNNKGNNDLLRCVRKGYVPTCANPTRKEGTIVYNTSFNVLQYCSPRAGGDGWQKIGP